MPFSPRGLRGHEKKLKFEKCAPLFSITYGRKMSVFPIFSHVPRLRGGSPTGKTRSGLGNLEAELQRYLDDPEGIATRQIPCRVRSVEGLAERSGIDVVIRQVEFRMVEQVEEFEAQLNVSRFPVPPRSFESLEDGEIIVLISRGVKIVASQIAQRRSLGHWHEEPRSYELHASFHRGALPGVQRVREVLTGDQLGPILEVSVPVGVVEIGNGKGIAGLDGVESVERPSSEGLTQESLLSTHPGKFPA